MKKAITFFFFFFLFAGLVAQTTKKISYKAEYLDYDEEILPDARRLKGNVVFYQENTIGYCDSAYLYESDNYLIAFGKQVRIYVGDSVTLYGNKVYYQGNTRIASIAQDVLLTHGNSILYTDSLIYDLHDNVGYYLTGGKMINVEDTLTSRKGKYYTKQDEIYLNEDVLLVNSSYTMDCSSLLYNTLSERVYFTSRTHMISDENEIFTTSGWYDTKNDVATLVEEVELYNKTQQMFADSVYYDKIARSGNAWNNVEIIDEEKGYVVNGNYVEYYETGGYSTITDSALLILIDNRDSLYMHSDTLKILFDSLQEPQLMKAYNHVKFYRQDMQGVCDSLSYVVTDSLLQMYYNPVVWSGENQLSADTIRFTILDSVNMMIELCRAGFIVSSLYEEMEFNQIKGANITGYIKNKELYLVDVVNNAECLYYIQEQDSSLIGINSSATSEMRILLKNNEISSIIFYNNPDGYIYPDQNLPTEDRQLKDFRWLIEYRPREIKDIYVMPIPRIKYEEKDAEKFSNTDQ